MVNPAALSPMLTSTTMAPTGFPAPVATTLPGAIERIVAAVRPSTIILFGSYAYGTPTPDSDVDFLVVMEMTASSVERYAAVSAALRPRPFPVDIVVMTPAELRRGLADGNPFLVEVMRRGQVVYEQPG